MCVWVGCIAKKPCASSLADALEKIEGIWAGYYTGIVTVDGGKLHHAKCAGCVSEWRRRFRASDIPGCSGLMHSRTNSGGGDNRAHPYMAAHGKVGVVGQGSLRCFEHLLGRYVEIGNTLADGRIFNSSEACCDKWNIHLKDGQTPSLSDIVSNAIEREYEKTGDPIGSMRKVGSEILEEADAVLGEMGITRGQLPKIRKSDPGIKVLETIHGPIDEGRVIKIVRKSETAQEFVVYRLVTRG